MITISAKTFLFQEGRIHVPILMLVRIVLLLLAAIILLSGNDIWPNVVFNGAVIVALFSLSTFVELLRHGPLGRPMLFLSRQELIVPRWSDSTRTERRVTLNDVTHVVVRRPYDMRVVRFTHSDGNVDELSAFWWRGYGDRVIACLQGALPAAVQVKIENPPSFMERVRGED